MIHSLIHICRIIKISRTLASHDALFPLDWLPLSKGLILMARLLSGFRVKKDCRTLRPGQKLAIALQKLGPSFIKFGQMLSTRPDLVGNELASDLIHLQDNLPPFSGLKAIEIVEAELGSSIHDLFERPKLKNRLVHLHFFISKHKNIFKPQRGIDSSFNFSSGTSITFCNIITFNCNFQNPQSVPDRPITICSNGAGAGTVHCSHHPPPPLPPLAPE